MDSRLLAYSGLQAHPSCKSPFLNSAVWGPLLRTISDSSPKLPVLHSKRTSSLGRTFLTFQRVSQELQIRVSHEGPGDLGTPDPDSPKDPSPLRRLRSALLGGLSPESSWTTSGTPADGRCKDLCGSHDQRGKKIPEYSGNVSSHESEYATNPTTCYRGDGQNRKE